MIKRLLLAACGFASIAHAQLPPAAMPGAAYGQQLEGFDYAYAVKRFSFDSQGKQLEMAYIDSAPAKPNGRTVVLLHGKNFCAGTWESTIAALNDAGYRVVAPDQIGFCKSTKPDAYQYTFQQLAYNTHALLASLNIGRVTVLGHSTGGMLGIRYALLYPQQVEQLALVNPIGLEDWKALGVPYRTVDQWFERELKVNASGIKAYEQSTYYAGNWKPQYDKWVDMLAGLNSGPGHRLVAWNSALIYDMIYTQPVIYEFGQLTMPTLLLIGDRDTTAIGADAASPEVKARIGHYETLGKQAARSIPRSTLVEFADLGHAPQIQDPAVFHRALIKGLASLPAP
ncbi:alpha/beta fold hydrolase [Herbaspirillum rhizosphaerae]|uniref:alpha/beta fold hydrolase n=1 Tax=Herbaspirillum rhizosphaerae TaxID=346179 RepID=UPI0009FA653C|nr:alpha/beta hydrolase [Herbaspirillum rhizosphaerae]